MPISTPHPGHYLATVFAKPLGLTAESLADLLKVPTNEIADLLASEADLTAEVAVRLAVVFNKMPEDWMDLQTAYSLERAKASENLSDLRKYEKLNVLWATGVPTVAGNYYWRERPGSTEHHCEVSYVPYGTLMDRSILCWTMTNFSFVDDGRGQWRSA